MYIAFIVLGFVFVLIDDDFWDITQSAQKAVAIRNAQNLEDLYQAALIGAASELERVSDVESAVALLSKGVQGSGTFKGSVFQLQLEEEEQKRVRDYLWFESGMLTYRATGEE